MVTLSPIPSPFILLDAVRLTDQQQLVAAGSFIHSPVWHLIEAAAQSAALHQRWLSDFSCHAFLLSIEECLTPDTLFSGRATITANLLGQSTRAAAYCVRVTFSSSAEDRNCKCPDWSAALTIGRIPYDANFQRTLLEARYRELFQCMTAPFMKTSPHA